MIDQIIDLIESHLDENMDLHTITGDFNYSNQTEIDGSCENACIV